MIWSRVKPSMSAIPLRTGCQRTPSRSVRRAPQFGFVEVAGGQLVPVQETSVDGPPHVVDALDPVAHNDVGVELWIVAPAGELGEPGRHVPLGANRPGLNPIAGRPILIEDRLAFAVQDRAPGMLPGSTTPPTPGR